MNVLILHGSPRREGNSDTLVRHLVRGLNATKKSQIKEFYANELNIRPCQGCLICAKLGNNTCAIEDDMQKIYSAFVDADIVVWATPMYWGYMTAQLKTVLDRMEALACGPKENWKGKTFVAIVTYHHHYESTVAFFERITLFFGVKLHTCVYNSLSKDGRGDVHVSNCREKLEEAFTLGKDLAKESAVTKKTTVEHRSVLSGHAKSPRSNCRFAAKKKTEDEILCSGYLDFPFVQY